MGIRDLTYSASEGSSQGVGAALAGVALTAPAEGSCHSLCGSGSGSGFMRWEVVYF